MPAVASMGCSPAIYPSRNPFQQSCIDAWLDMARGLEAPLAAWLEPAASSQSQPLQNKVQAKAAVEQALAALERHLSTRTYLVGESITLADSGMALTLRSAFESLVGRQQQQQHRNVVRWLATCCQHPALAGAAGGELRLCTDSVGWKNTRAGLALRPSSPPRTPPAQAQQQQGSAAAAGRLAEQQSEAEEEELGSPTATENGPAVQPISIRSAASAAHRANSSGQPNGISTPQASPAAALDGQSGQQSEDPVKKAKKDAKAAEKAAKKAKAAAKAEAAKAAEADKGKGAASEKKAKAKAEAEAKRAADAAAVQQAIKTAQATPLGQRKDVSGEMPKGYVPLAVEAAWYDWWEGCGFFKPEEHSSKEPFVIVIPPPNVTGSLHLGHALTNAIQDTVIRWRRMCGYNCLWLPGTDHAGIATQTVVEKALARDRGLTRHDLGRDAFLKEVFQWVERYGGKICNQLRRIGSSVDWSRLAFTMDGNLSLAVREAFVQLHRDGLIYRDNRLVNWCCTLHTAVSDIELEYLELERRTMVNVPGYSKPVEFGALTEFAYPLEGSGQERIVVATTRPETMLGDTGVAVHPDDPRYKHLQGKNVVHPLDGRKLPIVLDAELVDMSFGTGAVKLTPAHDPNDFQAGKRHGLQFINILEDDGTLNAAAGHFKGQKRFEARTTVVDWLKGLGLLVGVSDNAMRVPLCSRSKDVIEPVLKPQWWVSCASMAKAGMEAVREGQLEIIPREFEATWFRWLENIRDWCISRQLWWGHRIPAYYVRLEGDADAGEPGTQYEHTDRWVVGVDQEAAQQEAQRRFAGQRFSLHQDEDVLDTWFSSGLWPFSTMGWPRQTQDLKQFYPGALLETGHDILFFWVARMVMLGLKLTGEVPFRQVYLHSMVRDAHGRKMSKSLGNVVDPIDVIEGITLEGLHKTLQGGNLAEGEVRRAMAGQTADFPDGIEDCGTDALRFALVAYTSQGRDINLDIKRVVAYRHWCNKLWNAIRFAMLNLGTGFRPAAQLPPLTFACEWILSCLTAAVAATNAALEGYDFAAATTAAYDFWQYRLCDVFIELTKPVMQSGSRDDQEATRQTLWVCLDTGLRLLHPFMPFVTEELWQRLPQRKEHGGDESIMTQPYPQPVTGWASPEAEAKMAWVEALVRAARKVKSEYGLTREKPDLFIQCKDRQRHAALRELTREVATLSGTKQAAVLEDGAAAPEGCAPAVVDDITVVHLLLTQYLDPEKELAKLDKEQERVRERAEQLKKRMAAPDYVGKTPERIRDQDMETLGKAQQELRTLEQQAAGMRRLIKS